MAKFITGNELNLELERVFENAGHEIVLISPYIKLHERLKSSLLSRKEDDKVQIIIVFGKNEEDMSRSMRLQDFNFFKEFPNIRILYEKRLHAKYYANEYSAILTSMNLYSYSQDNNIEFGVLTERSSFKNGGLDQEAWGYFNRVIDQAKLLYKKEPQYEKSGILGMTQKYTGSVVVKDQLSDFFLKKETVEKSHNSSRRVVKENSKFFKNNETGYCIRTGKEIPYDIKKPFSYKAFENWNKFKNEDYSEKYCHFSGEPSNGETSFARPILKKNWRKANQV